jgi:hypothetical protein
MQAMISGVASAPLFGRLNPNCISPSFARLTLVGAQFRR